MTFGEPMRPDDMAAQAHGGPVSVVITLTDLSRVGEARRRAATLGMQAGLNDAERGALAVVVTEAATNLAQHATDGRIVLRTLGTPPGGVEVLALDKSPGIHDVVRAMADGYSTRGTTGTGLGAIRRMASQFDLFSTAETGTALLARVWSAAADPAKIAEIRREGAVCVPIAGEQVCGDGWMFVHSPGRTLAVLVDGLGHGPDAALAADEALRIVRAAPGLPASRIIERAHGALMATRGAAIAIAEILPSEQIVRFTGVGNISGIIATAQGTRSMASNHGTVGHTMRKTQEFTYPWSSDACLILHTDGIMTRWHLDAYPGILTHHPALLAGILYRDFTRGRDDATVLVLHGRHQ